MIGYMIAGLTALAFLSGCSKLTPEGSEVAAEGDCAYCHETPPATGAHLAHAQDLGYGCNTCHPGMDSAGASFSVRYHNDGDVNVRFSPATGLALTDSARFIPGQGCSGISCHGFGRTDTLGISWAPGAVSWTLPESLSCTGCHDYSNHKVYERTGMNIPCYGCHDASFHTNAKDTTLACGSCHGLPPNTGAMLWHADSLELGCGVCHLGYNTAPSSAPLATHINGTIDVNGPLDGGTYSPAGNSCSNVSCHGYGQTGAQGVVWATGPVSWSLGSLSCTGCHNAAAHNGGSGCQNCHRGTTSDGITISNHDLHANGVVEAALGACGSCHALPPATGSHAGHNNPAKKTYDCSLCHSGYSIADSSTSPANHINDVKNVDGTLGGGTFNGTSKACSNTYCHGNFTGGARATPVWGGTAACGSCHTMTPITGEHKKHREAGFGCDHCHQGYAGGATVNGALHINNANNVGPFIDESEQNDPDAYYNSGRCYNLNCHATHVW